MQTNTETPTQEVHAQVKVDFGDGRYSKVMTELYGDAQRLLGLSSKQAEKAARQYGVDLGRYFASAQVEGINVGNAKKSKNWDGQVTLKEAVTKVKGHLTHALCVAKLCAMLQDAKTYGITSYPEVELSQALQDWLNNKPATA